MHLKRHSSEDDEFEEVIDSGSFQRFGEKYLSKPGKKAGIEKRTFAEVKKEDIEQRQDEVKL